LKIADGDWPKILETLSLLIDIFPDDPRKPLVVFSLPLLHDVCILCDILCAMVVVSKFLPDFWSRDAEMMAVALMSDIGGKKMLEDSAPLSWTKARLGQCILLIELIGRIQAARHEREASPVSLVHIHVYRFCDILP
jgi:hypothetical protein